jgi:hypothetical protein
VLAGGPAAEGLLAKATRAHIRLDSGAMLSPRTAVDDVRKALAAAERRVKKAKADFAAERRRSLEAKRKVQETARKLKAVESALVAEERSLSEAQLQLVKLRAAQRTGATEPARPLEVAR